MEPEYVLIKQADLTKLIEAVQQGFEAINGRLDKVTTIPVHRRLPKEVARRALREEVTRPAAQSA